MVSKIDITVYSDNKLLNYDSDIDFDIFENIKEHGRRVASLAVLIGKQLELKEKELSILNQSALLHDYGKYYIPRNILLKPVKLTQSEMSIIRRHTWYGSKISMTQYKNEMIADIILYHHENCDGTGYYRLKENDIPLCSKIIRIADVFDALTCHRPYRKALSEQDALDIIDSEKSYYNKEIYEAFLDIIKESQNK